MRRRPRARPSLSGDQNDEEPVRLGDGDVAVASDGDQQQRGAEGLRGECGEGAVKPDRGPWHPATAGRTARTVHHHRVDHHRALHAARPFTGFLYGHVLHELQERVDDPDETDDLLNLGLHRLPITQFPEFDRSHPCWPPTTAPPNFSKD